MGTRLKNKSYMVAIISLILVMLAALMVGFNSSATEVEVTVIEDSKMSQYTGIYTDGNDWYYMEDGKINYTYTGMANNEWGWWYFKDGKIDWTYTGEASNVLGTWYYENGHINWDANGVIWSGEKWRVANGGHIDTNYTGMADNIFGWWYFNNGDIDFSYTGMASNVFGWWYYIDGRLNWTYTGEGQNIYGLWFYENGRIKWDANGACLVGARWRMVSGGHIDASYTGMANNLWGWWYFTNGDINWTYTGEGQNALGLWFYENGSIKWDAKGACLVGSRWRMVNSGHIEANYTGMANNLWGWWYFINGEIDLTYTGIGENAFGKWLYENGRLNFDFTGDKVINGITYHFIKGHDEDVYYIMGGSNTSVDQMVRFYNNNASYPLTYILYGVPTINDFCQIYYEECAAEGVKAEVAFTQAMLETNFLRFTGRVPITALNFAGIGATDSTQDYNTFSSVREGIRAQVQHLKAYASTDGLVNWCVDPRFYYVTRGCSPYVESLGGRWASGADYGYKIRNMIVRLLTS